jgi:hypothetical protein
MFFKEDFSKNPEKRKLINDKAQFGRIVVEKPDKEDASGSLKNVTHSIIHASEEVDKRSSLLPSSLGQTPAQNHCSGFNIPSQEKMINDKNQNFPEKKIISSQV